MFRIPANIAFRKPNPLPHALTKSQGVKKDALKSETAIDINPRLSINVKPPFSIIGGLKIKEETFDLNNGFVRSSPLRKAITNKLLKEPGVDQVFWRESIGALELGAQGSASVPLGEFGGGLGASVNFGFETSGILGYRYIRPLKEYEGQNTTERIDEHVAPFPLTFSDAMSMPLGREVEIIGTGRLELREGFSLSEGVGVQGVAKVGASLSMAAVQGISGEYALSVTALDGKKLVRVAIRKTNEHINELDILLRAGLLKINIPLPSLGNGALAQLIQEKAKPALNNYLSSLASVSLKIGSGTANKDENICSYDFDLSMESAQQAYEQILRLKPALADKLAEDDDSGITKVSVREREVRDYNTNNFNALNQQIYASQKATITRDGTVHKKNNAMILYKDKIYQEKSNNWFTGSRELSWAGITVRDTSGDLHTYYKFAYKRSNTIPHQSYIDKHFSLAKYLGVKSVCQEKSTLIEMNDIDKLFSNRDDVKASIELFFTEEGVERIQNANEAMGLYAFLRANMDNLLADDALVKSVELLDHYEELVNSSWLIFGKSAEMTELITSYKHKFNRDLEADLETYKNAKEFARFIANFTRANDSLSARKFFALLGNNNFSYTEVLKALTLLAGRSHVKVHDLSLSGGEVAIKSIDEGEILHPKSSINILPGSKLDARDIAYA